jgi:hypothetical protein
MPTSRRRNRRGRKNRRGGGEDAGDEGREIGELRELPILVLGGTGENTLMSACTSGIQQNFFRAGSFIILANTSLGVVQRMEGRRRPGMGEGKGYGRPVRGR